VQYELTFPNGIRALATYRGDTIIFPAARDEVGDAANDDLVGDPLFALYVDPISCGCREPGHLMQPAGTRVGGRRVGLVGALGWPPRNVAGCRLQVGADPVIGAGGAC
jgi:hypothetical protein